MKYDSIREEIKWWGNGGTESTIKRNLTSKHDFANAQIRSSLYDAFVSIECDINPSILEVGCGSREDAIYIQKASKNIIGVDIVPLLSKSLLLTVFMVVWGV